MENAKNMKNDVSASRKSCCINYLLDNKSVGLEITRMFLWAFQVGAGGATIATITLLNFYVDF